MTKLLACALLVAASGCPDVTADQGEGQGQLPTTDGPTVEFDPANSIIPLPNNLVLDPTTGKVALPAPACESAVSKQLRTGVLNTLDGFGTYEAAMSVTFTDTIDASSLTGKIVMYERMKGSTSIDPASATQIPLKLIPGTTLRYDASDCSSPATINSVTVVPEVPLDEKSTYTVAVLSGVQTSAGSAYLPSFTWALVRQSVDPVTLDSSGNIVSNSTPLDPTDPTQAAEIVAIDGLWKAEATGLAFLDGTGAIADRSDVLVGWEVTTQTTTDPLDPNVPDSVASSLGEGPILGTYSVILGQAASSCPGAGCGTLPPQASVQGVIEALLESAGIATSATANATCQALHLCGTDANHGPIGDVLAAALPTNNYQQHVTNTLANGGDLPGAWSDPLDPASQTGFITSLKLPQTPGLVEVLVFVPNGDTSTGGVAKPAGGWPTVIFGHGLGSQKETLILLAGALATQGIASVAIDFVNSGSRAIRISDDPTLGCGPGHCNNNLSQACYTDIPVESTCSTGVNDFCTGAPSYSTTSQCYAPFLSTDLAGTRDNMRQTILDLQRLVLAVKACGSTQGPSNPCGTLAVDPTKLMYTGISLGGIIGSTVTSIQPDLVGGVLNVPGVGWLDILENSQTNEIKCPLVDALIEAGVVTGALWNGMDGAAGTGECTTNDWLTQPSYQTFAQAARWILDPADGANFVSTRLPAKKFLIEEVINDQVVPNVATNNEGALVGQTPVNADPLTPLTQEGNVQPALFDPSSALQAAPTTSHWLQYPTVAAGSDAMDPWGIAYQHASLLEPVSGLAGHCAAAPTTTCTQDSDCTGTPVCVFPGELGTARLQADAAYFLKSNE